MLRSISTAGTLPPKLRRRSDGRLDVPRVPRRQVEALEAARPRGEPDRDARLLVREAARAAPERQARRGRRRHGEEADPDAERDARAERRQARDAGPPGARGGARRPRPAGAGAQVRDPAAAAKPPRPGEAA